MSAARSKEYRVCNDCIPPHIENCDSCFGYGLKKTDQLPEGVVPLAAKYAKPGLDITGMELIACPECGSTIEGYKGA